MIKKVKTEQLRVGAYVHDFNCAARKRHLFIDKAFIQSEKAIQIVQAWGIDEVYIDTEKGLDVKPGEGALELRRKIDRGIREQALKTLPEPPLVPLREELVIASKIKQDAIKTVRQAMWAVENHATIEIEGAYQLIEEMERSVARNRDALLLLLRMRKKDEYTLMHSISVSSLVLAFCNFCDMPYETSINMAMGALLHDIGKTKVPLNILNRPGKLTLEEMEIIRKHTEYSAEAMSVTKELPYEAFDIALHHHERQDGSGYPHQLKGDGITLAAKIASICDVFDALTSHRCYKSGISRVAGLRKLYEWSGAHFDQDLAYKFISMIGVYPVGTCVRLENDLIGMVSGSTENMLQPVVLLFYDDKAKKAVAPKEINLVKAGMEIDSYETMEKWSPDMVYLYKKVRSVFHTIPQGMFTDPVNQI